jgi:hypothetical protein
MKYHEHLKFITAKLVPVVRRLLNFLADWAKNLKIRCGPINFRTHKYFT